MTEPGIGTQRFLTVKVAFATPGMCRLLMNICKLFPHWLVPESLRGKGWNNRNRVVERRCMLFTCASVFDAVRVRFDAEHAPCRFFPVATRSQARQTIVSIFLRRYTDFPYSLLKWNAY
jgi:hypothetical protein